MRVLEIAAVRWLYTDARLIHASRLFIVSYVDFCCHSTCLAAVTVIIGDHLPTSIKCSAPFRHMVGCINVSSQTSMSCRHVVCH